ELEEIETQDDTRDGTDYALNGDISTKVGGGVLRLHGFYVFTDRTEKEFTQNFEIDGGGKKLNEGATQLEAIKQHNLSIASEYTLPIGRDELKLIAGFSLFKNNLDTKEREGDTASTLGPNAFEFTDTLDRDWFATAAYTHYFNSMLSVKVGIDGRIKTRDFG